MIKRPTVYRHFDKEGQLLYVGASSNVLQRTVAHSVGSDWFEQVHMIKLERFDSYEDMLLAEKQAIAAENPLYNIRDAFDSNGKPKMLRRPPVRYPPTEEAKKTAEYVAMKIRLGGTERHNLNEIAKGANMNILTVNKILDGYIPQKRTLARLTAYFKKLDRKFAKETAQ